MVSQTPRPPLFEPVFTTTADPARVAPAVVYQANPPTSGAGSVRCVRCNGWIVNGSIWYVNGSQKPHCDNCVRRDT